MNYGLLKELIGLCETFEHEAGANYAPTLKGFKKWLIGKESVLPETSIEWENKAEGRSAESVIATLLVHMNRYAKLYFRSVLEGTSFSSQDDVIYLIVLRFNPGITKTELIKKNVHDKPAGIQIINRLIESGWVKQSESEIDKRAKTLQLTAAGKKALDKIYDKIQAATTVVSADLTETEKTQLLQLLTKLNNFHLNVYNGNHATSDVLDVAMEELK